MTEETNHAKEQAHAQYESICAMVAALDVDYDRLEELREDRENRASELNDAETALNEDTDEVSVQAALENECDTARGALAEWDEENGEEFRALSEAANDCENHEAALDRIQEHPLSVEVRSGWYSPGDEAPPPEEFNILLCTGGPAVRIKGELDEHGQPTRAWLEHQDWGTSWQTWYFDADQSTLLAYCSQFFFGE